MQSTAPKFRTIKMDYIIKPSQIKRDHEETLSKFNGAPEKVLQNIRKQILSSIQDKANQQAGLTNITLNKLPYRDRNPITNQIRIFNQVYGFTIEGKKESEQKNFRGTKFHGKIYFANNHPQKEPTVIMDEVKPGYHFQMLQSYQNGQICLPIKGKKQYLSVTDLLQRLESVIYYPEPQDAADVKIATYYSVTPSGYWKVLREQAKELRDLQRQENSEQSDRSEEDD